MKSQLLNKITHDIWMLGHDCNIKLCISHIPGKENTEADLASQHLNFHTEWMLPKQIFKLVYHRHSFTPTIDLFTSHLNHQLPQYCSFTHDPFTIHVDTSTFPWHDKLPYLIPPFNILHRHLQKIQSYHTTALLPSVQSSRLWSDHGIYPNNS